MKWFYIMIIILVPVVISEIDIGLDEKQGVQIEPDDRRFAYVNRVNNFTQTNYFMELIYFYGGINLGTTTDTTAGNMRFTSNQFQGYNGTDWVALSGAGGADTTCEDGVCNLADDYGLPFKNLSFTGTTGFDDWYDNDTTYTHLSNFTNDLSITSLWTNESDYIQPNSSYSDNVNINGWLNTSILDTRYIISSPNNGNGTIDFLGSNISNSNRKTLLNLVSLSEIQDGSGATHRNELAFYSGAIGEENKSLVIATHQEGTQVNHVTFYSNIKNSTTSSKAFEWRWHTDTEGFLRLVDLNVLYFPENYTGFYENETKQNSAIYTDDSVFEIRIDQNADNDSFEFNIQEAGVGKVFEIDDSNTHILNTLDMNSNGITNVNDINTTTLDVNGLIDTNQINISRGNSYHLYIDNPDVDAGYWSIAQTDSSYSIGGGQLIFVPNSTTSTDATVSFHNDGEVDIRSGNLDMNDNNITNVQAFNTILYVQPDNATDIQAKLDMCPSTGCHVIIPEGTYVITTPINIPSYTTLEGSYKATTLVAQNNLDNNLIASDGRVSNVVIRDLLIDGNSTYQTSGSCIMFDGYYSRFENLWIVDCEEYGIYINSTSSSTENKILNSRIQSNVTNIKIDTGSSDFMISHVTVTSGDIGMLINTSGGTIDNIFAYTHNNASFVIKRANKMSNIRSSGTPISIYAHADDANILGIWHGLSIDGLYTNGITQNILHVRSESGVRNFVDVTGLTGASTNHEINLTGSGEIQIEVDANVRHVDVSMESTVDLDADSYVRLPPTPQSSVPSNVINGTIYLDDGSNANTGTITYRHYNGTEWHDISPVDYDGNLNITGSYYGDGSQLTGISADSYVWTNESDYIQPNSSYSDNVNIVGYLNASEINSILYVQAGNASDIQATINECPTDGCTVKVPNGFYNLSSGLDLIDNLTLEGESKENTILWLRASVDEPTVDGGGENNIVLKGFTIDHNGAQQTGDVHNVRFITSNNIIIENNIIKNSYHHNINTVGDNITIRNNIVTGNGQGAVDGGGILILGDNNIVSQNTVYDSDFTGIEVYVGSSNSKVVENTIYWSGSSGNLGAISVMDNSNFTIVDNNLIIGDGTNKAGSAVKLSGSKHTIFSNNEIRDINLTAGVALWVAGAEYETISDNKFIGGYRALYIEGDYSTISNNQFYNNSGESIYVRPTANDTLIEGNHFNYGASASIRIAHQDLTFIKDNTFVERGSNALFIENADRVTIISNDFINNNGYGIRFQNTNYTLATSNYFCGNVNGAYQDAGIESYTTIEGNRDCSSQYIENKIMRLTDNINVSRSSSGDAISMWGSNDDLKFMIGESTTEGYGFYYQYLGTGTGNDNEWELWTEGEDGADVQVFEVEQDGDFNITQNLEVVNNITVSGYYFGNGTNIDSINCSSIYGGGDADYCEDADSGGTAYDQSLNTTDNVKFNQLNVTSSFSIFKNARGDIIFQ